MKLNQPFDLYSTENNMVAPSSVGFSIRVLVLRFLMALSKEFMHVQALL